MTAAVVVETIPAALDGERLDRVVALLADVSRAAASALIAAGAVTIDGAVATSRARSRARRARWWPSTTAPSPCLSHRRPIPDVAFDGRPRRRLGDRGRQAGRARGPPRRRQPRRHARERSAGPLPRPGRGRRTPTARASCTASTPAARGCSSWPAPAPPPTHSSTQFAAHTAGRRYQALVWGASERGARHHRRPDRARSGRSAQDGLVAGGRPARTEYEVVARLAAPAAVALLACRLETGRTHQIRVHLAGIGHPLVGDSVYGERRADARAGRGRSCTPPSCRSSTRQRALG